MPGTTRARRTLAAALLVIAGAALARGQETDAGGDEERRDSDVGERLIRDTAEGADADVMAQILRLMRDVGRLLEIEFDPGPETQAMQEKIVDRLDDAIMTAAKQRRRARQRAAPSGDRRSRPEQSEGRPGSTSAEGRSAEESASGDPSQASSAAASTDPVRGDLLETRRSWGNLPQRERDEVIQGIDEAYLRRYRELIERYYRALQETEE